MGRIGSRGNGSRGRCVCVCVAYVCVHIQDTT